MKKLLKISLILFCSQMFSQSFFCTVTYQTKMINSDKPEVSENNSKKIDKPQMDALNEAFRKSFEKKYTLTFNKNEALFIEEQELEKPVLGGMKINFVTGGLGGKKYVNIKEKFYLNEVEIMNEEFLIKDSLKKINWKILNETKKIGDYICNKAQYTIEPTADEIAIYQTFINDKKNDKKMLKPDKPVSVTFTAWYTPEISVSIGPNNICGLPGLILEYCSNNMIYLCTSIKIKTNEKSNIKMPNTGKKVSNAEFKTLKIKAEELLEERISNSRRN